MPEELDLQQLKKEYPEFFENIPQEILKIALSEETPLEISAICVENGVADEEKIKKIAYIVASVLLGRIPIEIISEAIQTSSKIDDQTAEKISEEINRTIFSQVKDELAELYKKEISSAETITKPQKKSAPPLEEKPKRPPGKDVYKEPIE